MQRKLGELLEPRLGYALTASPSRVMQTLAELAGEEGCDEEPLLDRLLGARSDPRIDRLVEAATVQHTAFFRHREQFDALRSWLACEGRIAGPVRAWSAGCATGEEAYSIALTARGAGANVRVLATDVSASAIEHARAGRYPPRRCRGLPDADPEHGWTAPPEVRAMVELRVGSLVGRLPRGPFDLIFCRNVLLYFDRAGATAMLDALSRRLSRNGRLVVAPAETVIPLPVTLEADDAVGWLRRPSETVAARRSSRPPPTIPPVPVLDRAARRLGTGDAAAAERELRAWIDEHPSDVRAWFLLGEALLQRGEPVQARVAFEQAAHRGAGAPEDSPEHTLARAAKRRAAP